MIPTTDPRRRQSPARRSKIVAGTLSAGALVAIVAGMTATGRDAPAMPTDSASSGGASTVTGTFPSAGPATPAAVPAPVPAPAPARSTPAVPHGVSKASGG
jgi:hypothetical protein